MITPELISRIGWSNAKHCFSAAKDFTEPIGAAPDLRLN
jgi:hypothetical protein